MRAPALLLLAALAGCSGEPPAAPETPAADAKAQPPAAPAPSAEPRAEPRPTAEAPSTDNEAEAARAVVRTYFAHIEAGDYEAAWALRWHGEADDAASRKAFLDSRALYAEHHATVGIPGSVEGAAGSLYVEVPVQLYGRLASGKPFSSAGTVTLRRVNDVPGSTAEQRRWRIYSRD